MCQLHEKVGIIIKVLVCQALYIRYPTVGDNESGFATNHTNTTVDNECRSTTYSTVRGVMGDSMSVHPGYMGGGA